MLQVCPVHFVRHGAARSTGVLCSAACCCCTLPVCGHCNEGGCRDGSVACCKDVWCIFVWHAASAAGSTSVLCSAVCCCCALPMCQSIAMRADGGMNPLQATDMMGAFHWQRFGIAWPAASGVVCLAVQCPYVSIMHLVCLSPVSRLIVTVKGV